MFTKTMIRRFSASLILFFIGLVAFAINPVMKFRDYNTTDGLSSDMVTSVLQDKNGYMWFGTASGLDRFDGVRFLHYNLPSVTELIVDSDNTLWIGTSNGLYSLSYNDNLMTRLDITTDFGVNIASTVNDIELDASDNLWIATEGQGVMYYDKKAGTLLQYSRNISVSTDMLKCDDGSLLVCAEGSKIFHIKDGHMNHLLSLDVNYERNRELRLNGAFFKNGYMYIAPQYENLIRVDLSDTEPDGRLIHKHEIRGISGVNCLIDYKESVSLLGTSNCLYLYDFNTGWYSPVIIEDQNNAFSYHVTSIYKDSEGGIWVATYGRGVYYMPDDHKDINFQKTMIPGQERSLAVTCFATDGSGSVLIGTKEGCLLRYRNGKEPKLITSEIDNIQCILPIGDLILIGTNSDGLYVIDKGKIVNYRYNRFNKKGLVANNVQAIMRSNDGMIWVGTEWGLCTFNLSQGEFQQILGDAGKLNITDIIEDNKSRIWLATANGRIIRTGPYRRQWNRYDVTGSDLSSGAITCLFEDSKENIIAGTDYGLYVFDEKKNQFFKSNVNFPTSNLTVCGIQEDSYGVLWVSSNSGIYSLTGDFKIKSCVVSSQEIGDCVLLPNSSTILQDGTICFGGTHGYYYFLPEELEFNNNSSNLLMSQVYVNGSPVNINQVSDRRPLKLRHNHNNITFEFALLNFSDPMNNRYYYILEGRESEWTYAGNESSVKYDNLASGRYVFKVKSENRDGQQANEDLEFELVIRKAWYFTYCAIGCYIMILIIACLIFLNEYRKKKVRLVYESKMRAYSNFATDVRDSVTLITVPLRNLLKDDNVSGYVKEYLQSMERSSYNLLNTIDHLLLFNRHNQVSNEINLNLVDLVALIDEIVFSFTPLTDEKGIALDKKLPSKPAFYNVDDKRLRSICSTLLSEALKYAETAIQVEFLSSSDSFSLQVKTDVHLSDAENEVSEFGLGLTIAQQFADDHGGRLDVTCQDGSMIYKLHLPLILCLQDELQHHVEENDGVEVILYLDENKDTRRMMTKLLSPYYKVLSASSSASGFELLSQNAVSLLICDVKLADMSGYDFCNMIKNNDNLAEIPLVFLTSRTDAEDKLKAYDVGADDYIEKPFDPGLLKARIKNILFNRSKLRDLYLSISGTSQVARSNMTIANKEFLDKLTSVILDHVADESFYIDDLASEMFLSKSSLYRRVKSLLDISPIDYIKKVRLHKAAEMLSSGDYEVGEVWHKVGFTSLAYFATCFKKEFDMTPSKYLKKSANGE